MGFYDKAHDTALRLLTKRGRTVTVTSITTGSYDPNTGSQATTTSTTTPKGFLTNHEAKDVDGTMIMIGDKKLLLDSSAAIKTDDTVTIGAVTYSVIGIDEKNYNGTRVMWICNVRGSA